MRTDIQTLLAVSFIALSAGTNLAAAQEACSTYTIQRGDTLTNISKRAYGNGDFSKIFLANRATIGNNPNLIEVGQQIALPCNETAAPAQEAPATETVVAAEAAPAAQPTAAALTEIAFVTGNDYPPFTGEDLPDGGIFTKLVRTAMLRGDKKQDYSIDFVNDWSSHLDSLLPRQAFDATFPWSRPDCENLETLSPKDAYRCTDFNFSESFYEIVDGFFAVKGSGLENAQTYEDYVGKRICRPESYSLSGLTSVGLVEPAITLVRPTSVADCFEGLATGTVDIAHLEVQVASDALADLGLKNDIVEDPHLAQVKTLRVMVHKSNPHSAEILDLINRGLTEMRESGEWFDIVSAGLMAQTEEEMKKN